MSTDSTELTFVRCPACRSLVPASQTRCRMCGASLDASAGAGEGEDKEARKPARVRQRTMSQPKSDLDAAASQLREPEPAGAAEPDTEGGEDLPADDPLSPYIEEVDDDLGGAEQKPARAEAVEPQSAETEEEDKSGWSRGQQEGRAAHAGNDRGPRPAGGNGQAAGFRAGEPAGAPGRQDDSQKAKVVVESGRRGGQQSGLSFRNREEGGRGREEAPPARETRAPQERESRQKESRPAAGSEGREEGGWKSMDNKPRPEPQQARENREQPAAPPPRREAPAPQPPREQKAPPRQPEPENQNRPAPAARQQPQPAAVRPQAGVKATQGISGRLFGWLVSYADPSGSAIELREGKFFITRTSLKPSDLILDHPSVSTPHALATVSENGGFELQDLLSDGEVLVRQRDGDSYQKHEMVQVKHGDWIRIGDLEFLVCLIAHVGVE